VKAFANNGEKKDLPADRAEPAGSPPKLRLRSTLPPYWPRERLRKQKER
jgi:hypothetical protein